MALNHQDGYADLEAQSRAADIPRQKGITAMQILRVGRVTTDLMRTNATGPDNQFPAQHDDLAGRTRLVTRRPEGQLDIEKHLTRDQSCVTRTRSVSGQVSNVKPS
jgi:hypothetical protein